MNLNKILQKMAENDAEILLTEADKEFCRQLAESAANNNTKKTRKKPKRNEKQKNEIDNN